MPDRVIYEYAIIRLVPKVEREEFINIGVILFSKKRNFLEMKYLIDAQRIRSFAADIDLDLLRAHLEAWEAICEGGDRGGQIGNLDKAVRMRWLAAPRSTIIQCSKIHPGRSEDPAQTLQELFQRYVLPA
jgi:hypothetical protein